MKIKGEILYGPVVIDLLKHTITSPSAQSQHRTFTPSAPTIQQSFTIRFDPSSVSWQGYGSIWNNLAIKSCNVSLACWVYVVREGSVSGRTWSPSSLWLFRPQHCPPVMSGLSRAFNILSSFYSISSPQSRDLVSREGGRGRRRWWWWWWWCVWHGVPGVLVLSHSVYSSTPSCVLTDWHQLTGKVLVLGLTAAQYWYHSHDN